jgi:hypothetical protein
MPALRPLAALLPALIALIALDLSAPARAADITVSDRHLLELDSQTSIVVEGQSIPVDELVLRPGMKVTAVLGANRGVPATVVELIFSFDFRGVITGTGPVEVLGQPLVITGDTELAGYTDAASIQVGDAVVVSGQFDPNGSLAASLVERLESPPGTWRLGGYVTSLGPQAEQLSLGSQLLDYTGVAPDGCDGPLAIGDFITARADDLPGYNPGDPIDTVTSIQCIDPVPPGTVGGAGGLEGVVGDILSDTAFQLGTLTIEHDENTAFAQGGPDDLEPGAVIELEGSYTAETVVLATDIEFFRPVVRVRAPVDPADVTVGESISALGLTFEAGPQLRDEDAILSTGLGASSQVEIRGWIDSTGALFANRVRDRGAPDAAALTLRGPVSNIAPPSFDILSLAVDTSSSTFADELGNPITEQQFFDLLADDSIVEIDAAQLDGGTNTLSGGVVTLIDVVVPTAPRQRGANSIIFGTVTRGTDTTVFRDRFEATLQ